MLVKKKFPTEFIPMGAIVTASGTGSEMNAGAVITNEAEKIKCGLFGAQADFAFLDPTYTMSVPFEQVISGAFDTLSHAMETYFGKPSENNLSDDINEAVMRSVIAYFTVPEDDVDTVAKASVVVKDGKKYGNTEYVANVIQQAIGGDLFQIEAVQEYTHDHDALTDFAADEKADNARP